MWHSMMSRQLALPFAHQPHYRVRDFLPAASNEAALAWLDPGVVWPGGRLALWGEAGVGKTHLLTIWAERAGADLIPIANLRGLPPRPLRPVALDDADACADEPALLHLLNAAAEAGFPLLLAARAAPARWPVALPDLRSRLRAMTAVELGAPEEALLDALLARLLADRQLGVPAPLQSWLRRRLPRSPAALREAVCRIDRAGLAQGRVNFPLLNAILPELQQLDAEPAGGAIGQSDLLVPLNG